MNFEKSFTKYIVRENKTSGQYEVIKQVTYVDLTLKHVEIVEAVIDSWRLSSDAHAQCYSLNGWKK